MAVSSANSMSEKEKTGAWARGIARDNSSSTSCTTTVRHEMKRGGDSVHPCLTPTSCLLHSDFP
eukprot:10236781-Alexandrium_andersonii.AAC.1